MRPAWIAWLVVRWVRFYTHGLLSAVARRRVGEIAADLHDQIAHERAMAIGDRRIAFSILSRAVRGIAADVSWRRRHRKARVGRASGEAPAKKGRTFRRSALRVAVGVALVLSLPLVASLTTDDMTWSLADFVAAGAFLTAIGATLELAARRTGTIATALGIAAFGVAAAVYGEVDDAPGLVVLGLLLVVSGAALGVRTLQRSR